MDKKLMVAFTRTLPLALLFVMNLANPVQAAEWQWSLPVKSAISGETNDAPRAFLWIPDDCRQVRAVLIGQHNMEEENLLERPALRAALRELNMAAIWITPPLDLFFRFDKGAGAHMDATLKALAEESGYLELSQVPVALIGHSAAASSPWHYAAWRPEKTLAAISVSGQWPLYKDVNTPPFAAEALRGVPGLVSMGEYEGAAGRATDGLKHRTAAPWLPLSMLQESGAGHFDVTDEKAEYIALYLKKAVRYRLKADGTLRPIDPATTGVLADRWRPGAAPVAPIAPVQEYAGDRKEAFWYFDSELAQAAQNLSYRYGTRKVALLGYEQDGKVVEQNPKTHQQVTLRFLPQADGLTFKLKPVFLDTVPPGRPEGWTGLKAGEAVTSPAGGKITIERICGPVRRLDDETFAVRFYRMGMNNAKRSADIWFAATFAGDDEYRRSVQQAQLRFPLRNTAGSAQAIDFAPLADQPVGRKSLPLRAVANSGLPVHFYVQEGPAEVDEGPAGSELRFTAIPPRARFPLKVTVVAWQWGRSIEPRVQTAEPVTRSFYLRDPARREVALDEAGREFLWTEAAMTVQRLLETPPATAPATPASTEFGNAISFNICKAVPMAPEDAAGALVRAAQWNNILNLRDNGMIQLDKIVDRTGAVVPGASLTVVGGATANSSNSFDFAPTPDAGDKRLFNGVFDQNMGRPTSIVVKGIPFARYDVVFYRADDGPSRAGKFQVGERVLYCRGGKSNPAGNGEGYGVSTDATQGNGTDIDQGNAVRFENVSGSELTASFTAVFAGDNVQRNKVAGFQIVERK